MGLFALWVDNNTKQTEMETHNSIIWETYRNMESIKYRNKTKEDIFFLFYVFCIFLTFFNSGALMNAVILLWKFVFPVPNFKHHQSITL